MCDSHATVLEHLWRLLLRDQRGQAALLAGLIVIPLLAGMGLVLDGGLVFFQHRGARNAADAGAYVAAKRIYDGADSSAPLSPNPLPCDTDPLVNPDAARAAFVAACSFAREHGYRLAEVSVAIPPLHPVTGASEQVEVIIARRYTTLFMHLIGISELTVRGVAVAGQLAVPAGAAIYALDSDACAGFDWASSGGLYVFGGPIIIDSAAANGCNPAGGALDKTSTGVLCVDKDRNDYDPLDLPPTGRYGCDGDGNINVVGGVDCPDPPCANIVSTPDLNTGPGGGGFSGDPLANLAGPDNAATGADPDLRGGAHAFEFCDNDSNGFLDSAKLNWPLSTDSRSGYGLRPPGTVGGTCTGGSGKVLPVSPLLPWGSNDPDGYNVCTAPLGSDGKHHMVPGIYWGGIYASGSSCAAGVHFDPGIYIIAGQYSMSEKNPKPSIDLDFSASNGPVTSGPIIFFVTSNPDAVPSKRPTGAINFQTPTTMQLSASMLPPSDCPTEPNYEGIFLFVTRTAPRIESTGGSTKVNQVTVQGSGDAMTIAGIWYDPNGEFQAEGSFRLLDSMLIFNVIDMQISGHVIVQMPSCLARSKQLFLLR